jgi:hypothetical protein
VHWGDKKEKGSHGRGAECGRNATHHLSIRLHSIGQVQAERVARPLDLRARAGPELVNIAASASPNLQLVAVSGIPLRHIQALVAVDDEILARDGPVLGGAGTSGDTVRDRNRGTICVRGCGQAFARIGVGMDELVGLGKYGRSSQYSGECRANQECVGDHFSSMRLEIFKLEMHFIYRNREITLEAI